MPSDKEYKATYVPVYLAIDTSGSMNEEVVTRADGGDVKERLIDIANRVAPAIIEACQEFSSLNDKLRLSLVEFNTTAKVVRGLGSPDDFLPIPQLTASGTTDYRSLFRLLRTEIGTGVASLQGPSVGVFRPTVFLITDGDPTGDAGERSKAWDALVDKSFKYHPNFFSFGVNDASISGLSTYKSGHGLVAVAKNGADAGVALGKTVEQLVQSLIDSSTGDSEGQITVNPSDLDPDDWDVVVDYDDELLD